jgi:Magnesium chelatase, subunit ChlI
LRPSCVRFPAGYLAAAPPRHPYGLRTKSKSKERPPAPGHFRLQSVGPSHFRRVKRNLDPSIRGHAAPLLALEIAAGAHNLLLEGAPGTGKTMLARRIPPVLPAMTREEAIEVTRIHGIAGLHAAWLVQARPFRAPTRSRRPGWSAGERRRARARRRWRTRAFCNIS